ncbi:uncharacterized protein LOC124271301 [Haliotis rubra]|uniref:uncharacterized protein LOC124271301 n=1 Tax=Haliotis rubra TaxID=36100 RepID=UPI001EE50D89|nr:uncharacterized protein LOC124271301 [Haliotis rubra]
MAFYRRPEMDNLVFTRSLIEEMNQVDMRAECFPLCHRRELCNVVFTLSTLCWYRKVDDTFTTIDKQDDPAQLLQHVNNQHPRIKFTMETEQNRQLPFLDVALQSTDKGLVTSVYRKPSHTDQYINYNSCHHPQIKQAIIATLTRRAKLICHPDNLNSEIDYLKRTFTALNGYPARLVSRTITKTLESSEPRLKPEPSPIRITIPYVGPVSHQIARLIKSKVQH